MHTVYTVGYANCTVEQLKAKVDELGARLIDVRFSPFSRDSSYTRWNLQKVFGPSYVWVKDFGNENYKGGPIKLHAPDSGVFEIEPLLDVQPIVLMCMCRDVERCHRKTVADLFLERGHTVVHLGKLDEVPSSAKLADQLSLL